MLIVIPIPDDTINNYIKHREVKLMRKILASILTLLFIFNSTPAVFAINAPVISQITKTEENQIIPSNLEKEINNHN